MEALGFGYGGLFRLNNPARNRASILSRSRKPLGSVRSAAGPAGLSFPLKQAVTAGSLALAGDTIAQFTARWKEAKVGKEQSGSGSGSDELDKDVSPSLLANHDWLRALRMASYGFLLYGPGSYAWYQFLDCILPKQTMKNIMLKVLLNQIILGPCVIAVVFAWNNLWLWKLSELPNKYQEDALPTLLNGFKFWIPVSLLNFWFVPLQARVAFMSLGSIFWNFCLSTTMSK